MIAASTIKSKLIEIENVLAVAEPHRLSLFTGQMSIGVFYACLFTFTGDRKHKRKCNSIVNDVIDNIENAELVNGLSDGFTGIAWGINYIRELGVINIDGDTFFEQVDEYIYAHSLLAVQIKNYDFMHQGLGGAAYALDRLPHKTAGTFLHNIVDALDNIKEVDELGIKWRDKMAEVIKGGPLPHYSLSMAHGVIGITSLLLRIYQEGINQPVAEKLIIGAIEWILNHKVYLPGNHSIFPNNLVGSSMSGTYSSLSWCYGDLSIGYVLYEAANVFDKSEWLSEALSIMHNCIGRRDPLNNPELNPMFCHGTSGISYLFNKFYSLTGDQRYLDESNFWLEKTLMLISRGNSRGKQRKLLYKLNGDILPDEYGILDGVSGIGLTFLSYLKPDLNWDKSLLLYQKK